MDNFIYPHEFFGFDKYGRERERLWAAQFCDEFGKPVERTRYTHPYNYDGYVIWRSSDYRPQRADNTIYSDRLDEWDYKKCEALRKKHLTDGKGWKNPQCVEAFLREWDNNPDLHLVLIMEYCNWSSGYPCWRFDYVNKKT